MFVLSAFFLLRTWNFYVFFLLCGGKFWGAAPTIRAGSPWQGEVVVDKDALETVEHTTEANDGKVVDDNFNDDRMMKGWLKRVIL